MLRSVFHVSVHNTVKKAMQIGRKQLSKIQFQIGMKRAEPGIALFVFPFNHEKNARKAGNAADTRETLTL